MSMDRQKLVQKFHNQDVKQKKNMGAKSSRSYRRKQKVLKRLEGKDYQADRVSGSGRSNEVRIIS